MERPGVSRSKYLSVIVPIYNEAESIKLLHTGIDEVLRREDLNYEIIYVDDGSQDESFARLQRLAEQDEHVQVIRFRRNFGQTAAMAAGIAHSKGEILVFMDGDLQNDPADIPRLLKKIDEGYDVVSGWREHRQDAQLSRKLPSRMANRLISRVTGVELQDYGCTLKAYRYEVLQHVHLYGEMHRFIPAYAALAGARVTELAVQHHARQFGRSKYGISRVYRVLLDLLTLKFLGSFGTKPLYAFGMVGLPTLTAGVSSTLYALLRNLLGRRRRQIYGDNLLPASLLLSGVGLLSVMLGLIAELLMRTYHETQQKPTYVVRQIVSQQDSGYVTIKDVLNQHKQAPQQAAENKTQQNGKQAHPTNS